MTNEDDEKALRLLEKAVELAEKKLMSSKIFNPFLLLLNDTKEELFFENDEKDFEKSYALLEDLAKEKVLDKSVDVMILALDTTLPSNISTASSIGIRLHLEEKSQRDNKLGARFIYVPYTLATVKDGDLFVKLHHPVPVGIVADYIKA